jgi:hypothetical protein
VTGSRCEGAEELRGGLKRLLGGGPESPKLDKNPFILTINNNACEQAELILRAALDPTIASRAKKGEFVTCFDYSISYKRR